METLKDIQEKITSSDNLSLEYANTIINELLNESEQSRDEFKYDETVLIKNILENNINKDKKIIISVLKPLDNIWYEFLSTEQKCYYKTLLYDLFLPNTCEKRN